MKEVNDYLNGIVLRNWNPSGCEQKDLIHSVLGLNEESGEVASLVKKQLFYGKDFDENPRNISKEDFIDELSDVFFYLMKTIHSVDSTLEEVIKHSTGKLNARHNGNFNGSYKK